MYNNKKGEMIGIIITIIILNAISLIPGSLEIHMVDVGQRRLHGYKNTA